MKSYFQNNQNGSELYGLKNYDGGKILPQEINEYEKDDLLKNGSSSSKYTERKVGGLMFIVTSIILVGKIVSSLKSSVWERLYIKQLVRSDFLNDLNIPTMSFNWEVRSNLSPLFWPILCGIGMTTFTWLMVYLDSDEPGINPPTPFSPSKERSIYSRRQRQLASCQLSYVLAICSGLAVFCLLYLVDLS